MTKKVIIFDLDNTIYSAPSICDDLFLPLYQLIQKSSDHQSSFEVIKQDMLRKPFHWVAQKHGFGETLTQQGIQLLEKMTYDKPMQPFADYAKTKPLLHQKFLVTTGFPLLQWSKIKSLNIENDFAEIHVVDITVSTKKEVFADIVKRHRLETADILVVGDDPQSEIEAAQQLGIDVVLYDKFHLHQNLTSLPIIDNYSKLEAFL